MEKKTGIILAAVIALFGALLGFSLWQRGTGSQDIDYSAYKLSAIEYMSSKNDYNSVDLNSIIPANEENGNFAENINGDKNAEVVIYEYADYPCSYCAMMNPLLNQIVEDYDGKVAIVFRSYILSYHERNGVQVASAANAAALQGYWKKYKDLLFENQDEWFYSEGDILQLQLEDYFEEVSDGKGDLEKFREDMKSENVAKKIAFDRGAGEEMEIGGTPWLYMDGEWICNKDSDGNALSVAAYSKKIREEIDQKLGQSGDKK